MCQACPSDDEPQPKKKRHRTHPSDYLYVRKVKGRVYQFRLWLHGLRSVNLGCFASEWRAGQAAKAFTHRSRPGVHIADVLDSLRRDGLVPAHVRLKYVFDLPNGEFEAKVKKRGKQIILKTFATEREAFEAMLSHLASLHERDVHDCRRDSREAPTAAQQLAKWQRFICREAPPEGSALPP